MQTSHQRAPRSGKVVHVQVRMPPPLQKGLAAWAIDAGSSLNSLALAILEQGVRERDASRGQAISEVASE